MATPLFHRVLVALPFPAITLNAYLDMFRDAGVRCEFVQVAPGNSAKLAASLQIEPESITIRQGDELDELLAHTAETQASLLLVSQCAPKRRVLARRLAMKAPCSVWMIPADAPAAITKILAPIDFSPRSVDALRAAASLARILSLPEITAIHVYFDEAVASYEGHQEVVRLNEESHLETFLSRIDLGDIKVQTCWEESSHVAETILRVAAEKGADLIVMGTRGRSRSANILIGSDADRVLAKSTVPVLAVKQHGANLGLLEALLDRKFHRRDEAHFG